MNDLNLNFDTTVSVYDMIPKKKEFIIRLNGLRFGFSWSLNTDMTFILPSEEALYKDDVNRQYYQSDVMLTSLKPIKTHKILGFMVADHECDVYSVVLHG